MFLYREANAPQKGDEQLSAAALETGGKLIWDWAESKAPTVEYLTLLISSDQHFIIQITSARQRRRFEIPP